MQINSRPYETNFQPSYEQFQQKISIISKEATVSKSKLNIQKILHEIDLIKQQMQDQGLEFHQNSIFKKYATIQQLTLKKKNISQCCYHCGQQIKKPVQCELCAQIYCKNCCWRKRLIPFEQHLDFRLSCQQCHQAYVKLFNNQSFYKQKAIYIKVLQQLHKKYQKSQAKCNKKQLQINQYKKQKQSTKLNQAVLKKSLLDQDKKIQSLKQQYTQLMKLRAFKNQQEQQQRLKNMENQIIKKSKQYQQQEHKKKLQKIKNQNQNVRQQKEIVQKQIVILEAVKQQLKSKQQTFQKQQQKMFIVESEKKVAKIQILPQQQIDFDEILNGTFDVNKKKNLNKQQKKIQTNKKEPQKIVQNIIKNKTEIQQQKEQLKFQITSQPKKQTFQDQNQKQSQLNKPQTPSITMNQIKSMNINDLLAMKIPMNPGASPSKPSLTINKRKQEFLRKSLHEGSQNSTTTQKQKQDALVMSVNDQLLGYVPGISLTNEQKEQASVDSFVQQHVNENQNALRKSDILRRSSLMSSTNQNQNKKTFASEKPINQQQQQQVQPQKCACQIM